MAAGGLCQIGIVSYAEATTYRWRFFLSSSWVGQNEGSMRLTVFGANVSTAQAKLDERSVYSAQKP